MTTGLLLRKRLSPRTLRDGWIAVDEALCTGATFSTLLNPDGDGKNYRLGAWLAAGTIAVAASGVAELLAISGGAGAVGVVPAQPGMGGNIIDGLRVLPAGLLPVLVGAGGLYGGNAGESGIGALKTGLPSMGAVNSRSAGTTTHAEMYHSSITGISTEYGLTRYYFATDELGNAVPRANRGDGAPVGGAGSSGVVYVRWQI